MRSIKRLSYVMIVMLMVAALVVACAPKPEVTPIKIGLLAPYTGFDPTAAPSIEGGIEVKLDEVGWEVAGRKIQLIAEDSASDPVVAVDKAKKLVEHDKVDVIIGPLFGHCTLAVASYLTPSRTPNLLYESPDYEAFVMGGRNVFTHVGTMPGTVYLFGAYAYEKLGHRTAVIVIQDYVTGDCFLQGFRDGFEPKGGEIVQVLRVPLGTMDFAPYLTSLKEADVVASWLIPPETMLFVKQYHNYGLKMPITLISAISVDRQGLNEIGDVALGMISTHQWSRLLDNPINKRFVDAYVKKYGGLPLYFAAASYIDVAVFLEAVKATGGDTTPEKINDAILKVKIDTPGGIISFNPEGIGIRDQYVLEVIKTDEGLDWKPLHEFSQVLIKAPSE